MLAGSRSVCNLFILKKLKQFADSPTSLRPQHATTITIQKWLKSRGVLGIDIEEPDATNNEDDIFGPITSTSNTTGDGGRTKKKSLKKGKSGGGSGVYDEEGAIPPPGQQRSTWLHPTPISRPSRLLTSLGTTYT
jgi:hypothetical protein